MKDSSIRFAFWGSSRFSAIVLDELEKSGFVPVCVVTTPDKPQGRKMLMTPTEVKIWAKNRNIKVFEPENLKNASAEIAENLSRENCGVFVVASYGNIIPRAIIDIPLRKTLNIHPSLLPKYRGPSPLQSAMLDNDKDTGVSIMRMDEEMDHGPIVAQEKVYMEEWPIYEEFEEIMARAGGRLLARVLPRWVTGEIRESEQNHLLATYTKKIAKEDGLIDFKDNPYLNFRKIQAFHEWPQAYFFINKKDGKLRVKITSASFQKDKLTILKVIPEGSREMTWTDFSQGYNFNAPMTEEL